MNLLVLLPLVVLVVGVVSVVVAASRTLDEADQLRLELQALGRLRPLLVEVGDGRQEMRAALNRLRR